MASARNRNITKMMDKTLGSEFGGGTPPPRRDKADKIGQVVADAAANAAKFSAPQAAAQRAQERDRVKMIQDAAHASAARTGPSSPDTPWSPGGRKNTNRYAG